MWREADPVVELRLIRELRVGRSVEQVDKRREGGCGVVVLEGGVPLELEGGGSGLWRRDKNVGGGESRGVEGRGGTLSRG